MLKVWVLLLLVLGPDGGHAWRAVDRFEHQGQCERAALDYTKPGQKLDVVTCVWSPYGVVR
jgi:hypothetical protein